MLSLFSCDLNVKRSFKFEGKNKESKLADFLKGYLVGLGNSCRSLFGDTGESIMYEVVGKAFLDKLGQKDFSPKSSDPFERTVEIYRYATEEGFLQTATVEKIGLNTIRIMETGLFTRDQWKEGFEKGIVIQPCPLLSLWAAAIRDIGYTYKVMESKWDNELDGFNTVVYFVKLHKAEPRNLRLDALLSLDEQRFLLIWETSKTFLENPQKIIFRGKNKTVELEKTADGVRIAETANAQDIVSLYTDFEK